MSKSTFFAKKKRDIDMSLFCTVTYLCYYFAEIAPVGHTDSQAPQSMQASVTSYFASPSTIAPAGQVDSQEPHFTHSSLITCILFHLQKIFRRKSYLPLDDFHYGTK